MIIINSTDVMLYDYGGIFRGVRRYGLLATAQSYLCDHAVHFVGIPAQLRFLCDLHEYKKIECQKLMLRIHQEKTPPDSIYPRLLIVNSTALKYTKKHENPFPDTLLTIKIQRFFQKKSWVDIKSIMLKHVKVFAKSKYLTAVYD